MFDSSISTVRGEDYEIPLCGKSFKGGELVDRIRAVKGMHGIVRANVVCNDVIVETFDLVETKCICDEIVFCLEIETKHKAMFEACDSQSWVKIRDGIVEMRLHPFNLVLGSLAAVKDFVGTLGKTKAIISQTPSGFVVRLSRPHLDEPEVRSDYKSHCAMLLHSCLLAELG